VGLSDNARKLMSWPYFDASLGNHIYDASTDDFQEGDEAVCFLAGGPSQLNC
jgi:hypothetical protein